MMLSTDNAYITFIRNELLFNYSAILNIFGFPGSSTGHYKLLYFAGLNSPAMVLFVIHLTTLIKNV